MIEGSLPDNTVLDSADVVDERNPTPIPDRNTPHRGFPPKRSEICLSADSIAYYTPRSFQIRFVFSPSPHDVLQDNVRQSAQGRTTTIPPLVPHRNHKKPRHSVRDNVSQHCTRTPTQRQSVLQASRYDSLSYRHLGMTICPEPIEEMTVCHIL